MSTVDIIAAESVRPGRRHTPFGLSLLAVLSSLQVTVVLFAFSLLLVLVGTLAQVEKDMWEVIHLYFRSWIAPVELRLWFPPTFFPAELCKAVSQSRIYIPIPGGASIGTALLINLFSAHLVRFRVQAKNFQLVVGAIAMALALALTALVILGGHNPDGIQGQPIEGLWNILRAGLVLAFLTLAYAAYRGSASQILRYVLIISAAGLGLFTAWLFLQGKDAELSHASLRILWQLLQAGFSAVVACVGAYLMFGKRAGIVTLHLGVALLMIGELYVAKYAVEGRMQITEGETVNYASDIRHIELAVVRKDRPNTVTAIPLEVLKPNETTFPRIKHKDLPFDLQLKQYFKNSAVTIGNAPHASPPANSTPAPRLATAGHGKEADVIEVRAASGATNDGVDMASLYVEFFHPGTDKSLGVYLLSQAQAFDQTQMRLSSFDQESIQIAASDAPPGSDSSASSAVDAEVTLRFKRMYKPYSVHLVDVRKDDYLGTDTPRNYSSDIRLIDPSRNIDRDIRIWMNNPLRYAGETFYQSNYQVGMGGREITDFQLVTNGGWMTPYVSCMYVAIGMLFHFSGTLVRFLRRVETDPAVSEPEEAVEPRTRKQRRRAERRLTESDVAEASWLRRRWGNWSSGQYAVLVATLGILGLWLYSASHPQPTIVSDLNLSAFGQLPVVYQGRTEPLDTLARNGLLIISDRETFDIDKNQKSQPAIRWLADLVSGKRNADGERVADQYPIIRIENFDVLALLDLKPNERKRYAMADIHDKFDILSTEVRKAREKDASQLTTAERKLIELDNRLRIYMRIQFAFQPIPFPPIPRRDELEKNRDEAMARLERIKELMAKAPEYGRELMQMQPPLAIPNDDQSEEGKRNAWQPYATAHYLAYVAPIFGKNANPATLAWNTMLDAYARDDASAFNAAVKDYESWLEAGHGVELSVSRINFEAFYNAFRPFSNAMIMYILVFVLGVASWLGQRKPLRLSAGTILLLAFAVHTFGVCGRMYISGRPPVTNLYSSAVFIGWGGVLFGIALETLFAMGIGFVVSSVLGFSTLCIAHGLAADGDTFTVLQAVLDTQFWLATHVTCITLGYTTTLLAGVLGIIYILADLLGLARKTTSLTSESGVWKHIARMTYGILCFSMFFTFIGTVLGGLWADDSWGRFWGWDPKENGALMIVLWNALILHARWGKMIGARGMAVLSVLGNIVVTWSWFGTNELGIGLHAYGFREGMVRNLWIFWWSQLVIAGLALIPWGTSQADAMTGPATGSGASS